MLLEPLEKCKLGGPGPAWQTDSGGAVLMLLRDGELAAHVVAVDPGQERELLAALDAYCLARAGAAVRRRMCEPMPAAMACSCGGACRGGGAR